MKREKDADQTFEWDMTVVILIVLMIAFLIMVFLDVGTVGHAR